MSPGGGGEPSGELAGAITSTFGSFATFKERFEANGTGLFGSGWTWLVHDGDALELTTTANQDSPVLDGQTPLLGNDVWEHAYYLIYKNQHPAYLKAWWNVSTGMRWPSATPLPPDASRPRSDHGDDRLRLRRQPPVRAHPTARGWRSELVHGVSRRASRGGIHHTAIRVSDFDAAVRSLSPDDPGLVQAGRFGVSARYGYVDVTAATGALMELIALDDDTVAMFDRIRRGEA